MQHIIQKQNEFVEIFSLIEDWEDKYQFIIEYGNKIPMIDKAKKINEYLVKGCQSNLWLDININNNNLVELFADCDADIPKGLASMIIDVFNYQEPKKIIDSELFFLRDSEILLHLSPLRQRGIQSLINKLKQEVSKFIQ